MPWVDAGADSSSSSSSASCSSGAMVDGRAGLTRLTPGGVVDLVAQIGRAQPTGVGRQQAFEPGSLSRERRPWLRLVHSPLRGSG